MAKLTEKQRAFVHDNPFAAIVTTLRGDGTPHSTVVWIEEEGGDVLFNTAEGRAKPRELKADPRVSVTMVDPSDMFKWISVSGNAELTTEGAREQIDRLAKKYLGKDEYPWYQGEQRVTVRIKPDKVDGSGLD
jgi:PPOX class probable F420-dependent enzyme